VSASQTPEPGKTLRVTRWSDLDDAARVGFVARGTGAIDDEALKASVSELVADVKANGDEAVSRALKNFDNCDVAAADLKVTETEFEAAEASVSKPVREAIRVGIAGIRAFNDEVANPREWTKEIRPGLVVGEKLTPISSAGLFVPSGKGSFPSVLMQIGTPAKVAGVGTIAVVVPPVPGSDGQVDPAVLCVARELGITDVFRANGPAGVAALAFGTESIPKVRKVVGPGSPPVAAAQVICQAYGCHSQMLLGPSESLVVADDSADVRLLAADLLIEAEHGDDSATLLVTPSSDLVTAVEEEITLQIAELPEPRRSYAAASLGRNGGAVIVESVAEAIVVANLYAPEHMQLVVEDEDAALADVEHAGEVLLGQHTPFSLANYVVGIPAALPTGRFARVTEGITAKTFMKNVSIAKADKQALTELGPSVIALADHEDFPAHAAAIRLRLEGTPDQ